MQKAKLSLIAAALLVPAFALSAYAADFVRPMPTTRSKPVQLFLAVNSPLFVLPL